MSLIPNHISQKVYFFSLTALAFSIPIHNQLSSLIVSLTGIFWLLEFNYVEKYKRVANSKWRKYLMSFSILYLLFFISLFYSENIHGYSGGALFNLEKRMSILGFPLLLSTIDIEAVKQKLFKQILKAFILGCMLSSFFLLNVAFFDYMQTNDPTVFYYGGLAQFHHPSYLALYFAFAIAIMVNWLLKVQNPDTTKRFAVYFIILFFQVMIVLLSSKAGILGMFIVYASTIVYCLFPGYTINRIRLLIPVFLLISFMFTLLLNPDSYRRFFSVENAMEMEHESIDKSKHVDGTVARIFVWQCSLEVIQENFLFGVGLGDTKQKLMDKYEEKNITVALKQELNAHNEYLQTFMALGVLGFLALILSLIIPAWFAFRRKKLVSLLFLILIAFHFLVESMLAKQAGIVFYAFFNAVLFYQAFGQNKNSSKFDV